MSLGLFVFYYYFLVLFSQFYKQDGFKKPTIIFELVSRRFYIYPSPSFLHCVRGYFGAILFSHRVTRKLKNAFYFF